MQVGTAVQSVLVRAIGNSVPPLAGLGKETEWQRSRLVL